MTTTSKKVNDALERIKGQYPKEEEQNIKAVLTEVIENGKPLKDALKYTPEMLEELYTIAQQNYSSGNYHDAYILFCILISLDDRVPKYHMGAGACCHMQKKFKEALVHYKACGDLSFGDPLPHYHSTDCFIQLGETPAAFRSVSMAIMYSENKPEYLQVKERSKLIRDKILEEAKQDMEEVRKLIGELEKEFDLGEEKEH